MTRPVVIVVVAAPDVVGVEIVVVVVPLCFSLNNKTEQLTPHCKLIK